MEISNLKICEEELKKECIKLSLSMMFPRRHDPIDEVLERAQKYLILLKM